MEFTVRISGVRVREGDRFASKKTQFNFFKGRNREGIRPQDDPQLKQEIKKSRQPSKIHMELIEETSVPIPHGQTIKEEKNVTIDKYRQERYPTVPAIGSKLKEIWTKGTESLNRNFENFASDFNSGAKATGRFEILKKYHPQVFVQVLELAAKVRTVNGEISQLRGSFFNYREKAAEPRLAGPIGPFNSSLLGVIDCLLAACDMTPYVNKIDFTKLYDKLISFTQGNPPTESKIDRPAPKAPSPPITGKIIAKGTIVGFIKNSSTIRLLGKLDEAIDLNNLTSMEGENLVSLKINTEKQFIRPDRIVIISKAI